jgi:hypothetical protein
MNFPVGSHDSQAKNVYRIIRHITQKFYKTFIARDSVTSHLDHPGYWTVGIPGNGPALVLP